MKFLIFIVLIFATYGHATTTNVATNAQALRDQFAGKLEGSPLTAEDIKTIADQSEKLLTELRSAGGSGLSSQEQAQALADLLTLKYPVHDTALNEGLILKNSSEQLIIKDEAAKKAFKDRLKENFEITVFKNLNNKFSKNTWQGHVKYPYSGLNATTTDISTKTVTGAFSVDPSNTLTSCHSLSSVSTCNSSDVTYTFNKPTDISKMAVIVISVYPGMKSGFCWETAPLNLPDKTIGAIGVKLPDCYSDVDQWNQFEESNFKGTHARYLRIVSNFVAHIKTQHPNIPIFLQGGSFGGFFVSSYALLQSVGVGTNEFNRVYKPFAQTAFTEQFPDKTITPVDGIISYSGATYYVNKIVSDDKKWSQHIKTPAFYHWNFDDERVDLKRTIDSILPPDGIPYNHNITLSVNRRGAQDSLGDLLISPDTNDLKRLYNAANKKEDNSVIRGHFNDNNPVLDQYVVHFIHHAKEMLDSPLHQARQKRQFDVYRNGTANDHSAFIPQHIQQFLSNLSRTQQELEQMSSAQRRATHENDIIAKHMRGIGAPYEESTLTQTYINFMNQLDTEEEKNKFVDHIITEMNDYSGFLKLPKSTEMTHAIDQAWRERMIKSINDDVIKQSKYNQNKIGTFELFLRIKDYPGFTDFILFQLTFEQRKAYHDRLMQEVTTKGLWHGAIERLKQDATFKKNIGLTRVKAIQQNVRDLNSEELQKTNPFLVEHISVPYDQRLTEFNKAPLQTENYSGYTDSIIKLLADPTKVSLIHFAKLIERKAILQAVMANEITNTHKNYNQAQQDQSEQVKNFYSEYIKHSAGTSLYNHFAALYLAADFAALRSRNIVKGSKMTGLVHFDDSIKKIIGINHETFNRWFNEVYRHHKAGIEKLHQG